MNRTIWTLTFALSLVVVGPRAAAAADDEAVPVPADEATSAEPETQAPAAETPPAEQPAAELPAVETPPADQPAAELPAAETPPAEEPAAELPTAETPPAEQPAAELPTAETPPAEQPAAELPTAETPPAEQPAPAAEAPAPELPTAEPAPAVEPAPAAEAPAPELPTAEPAPAGPGPELPTAEQPAAPAGELPAEQPAAEAPATEVPATEVPAEAPAAEGPATEVVPVEAPAAESPPAEAAPAEAAPAEAAPAEAAPAEAAETEVPATEEAAPAAAAAAEAPAPVAPLKLEREVTAAPVWRLGSQDREFDDFVRAGMPSDSAVKPVSRVVGPADADHNAATTNQDILVSGTHPRGRTFVAYRPENTRCSARYLGLVVVDQSAGPDVSRGVVRRARDGMYGGDLLYSLDDVRADFDRQRRAARGGTGRPVVGKVHCFGEDRVYQARVDDTLIVDRGSADGVAVAWLCEIPLPGRDRQLTYGRVVKVTPHQSFVTVMKIFTPVQLGDQARLSRLPLASGAGADSRR